MIPQAYIDELLSRLDIVSVIDSRIKLKKTGKNYSALCPFHDEKSPSFSVSDEKQFYYCLGGDTGVITKTGTMKIKDMAGSSHSIIDGNGNWVLAHFDWYGRRPSTCINLTRNGIKKTIIATPDHRWFVRGRKNTTTDQLKAGHRLETVYPERNYSDIDESGIRHGIVFGDGTNSYKSTIVDLHDKKMDLIRFFGWFKSNEYKRAEGHYFAKVSGLPAEYKALPSLENSNGYLAGFLAGYLATDGHIAKDGTVSLNSSIKSDLAHIRDICTKLGIATMGITTQNRKGIDGKFSDIHRIHFYTSSLSESLFLRSDSLKRFKSCSKKFERRGWVVESIEQYAEVVDVYCCTVNTTSSFVLEDNILTGNCFGCGSSGHALGFVLAYDGGEFPAVVEKLAQSVGMAKWTSETQTKRSSIPAERRRKLEKVLADESYLLKFTKASIDSGTQPSAEDMQRARKAADRIKKITEILAQ